MPSSSKSRRDFLKTSLASAAAVPLVRRTSTAPFDELRAPRARRGAVRAQDAARQPRMRFAAIGLNHGHITGQVEAVKRGGGTLVSFYAKEPDLAADFAKRFPEAALATSPNAIYDDSSIQLIVSAAIPSERAGIAIEAMRHGKDVMLDKPGMTTLDQLAEVRRVQSETKRIVSILYSERLENRGTVKAGELVKAGAIGRVVQTAGFGPHRIKQEKERPAWFWERERYGGILCDIASHQFDQFLFFTGSTKAEVIASQVGNVNHPDRPGLEDFGDVMLRGDGGSGYIRVDWFTPDGLNTWGDGRLTVLGTEGYIEVRKNVDIGGRPGGSHLFLVDQKDTRHIDCSDVELPYGERLVDDILNRTETAMPQAHTFLAQELALIAQKNARRLT